MSSRSRPTHSRFWNRCGVPDAVETASWVIFKHPREHDDWGRSPLRSLRFLVSVVAAAALLFASLTPPLVGAAQAPPGSLAFSAAGDYGSWSGLRESLAQLAASESDFVLALGDLSYGGNTGYANSTEQACVNASRRASGTWRSSREITTWGNLLSGRATSTISRSIAPSHSIPGSLASTGGNTISTSQRRIHSPGSSLLRTTCSSTTRRTTITT